MVVPRTEIIITRDGTDVVRKSVPPGDYVIGRDGSCDLPVEGEAVSGRHAQLTINYDHALIEDLGSDSGTFVNGQRVSEPTRLWPSQKIQVGSATITLRRKKAAADNDQTLAPQAAAVRQLLPEELLHDGKYEIGGQIARGGMGAILNAKEVAIRREVAMKVMLESSGREDLVRFVEEAQITGQLEHPNIVPVHELSVDENDQIFYTMKMVRGVTLRHVVEQLAQGAVETVRKFPLPALLTIFQKVCDAVAFAHSRGVIHRDLKPDNIMLGDYGEVLVMDWGLAKLLGTAGRPGVAVVKSAKKDGGEISATLAGAIMGTPQYMAPEQARGEIEALDARSDIYALGAILYHILALCPPIDGATLDEILAKVSAGQVVAPIKRVLRAKFKPIAPNPKANRPPPQVDPEAPTLLYTGPITTSGPAARLGETSMEKVSLPHLPGGSIPESLNAVVMKAMALQPPARYQSIPEFQADLTAYQTGFATRAERASFMKQFILLVKRHKGIFATAAAAWLIITALAVWFIISIRASERKATHNAEIAEQNARIAAENEKQATQNAALAEANEKKAVAEKEATRHALAKAQFALAEGAFREEDGLAMQAALNDVPEDLRDTNWSYLLARADTSLAKIDTGNGYAPSFATSVAPHPTRPGVFAIATHAGKILVVDAATGKTLLTFEAEFAENQNDINAKIAFSPDGERIAVGRMESGGKENNGGIVIYSAQDGSKLSEFEAPKSRSLEFDHDGKRLLQISTDSRHLNVLDATSGKLLWAAKANGNARGAFDPKGEFIVTYDDGEKFRILSAKDGSLVRSLPKATDRIDWIAIHPDGKRMVTGDGKGSVRGWDLSDDRTLFEIRANDHSLAGLALTSDGERFVTLANEPGGRQSVQVWRLNGGKRLQTLLGGSGLANSLAVHPLSGELVVAGQTSRSWSLRNAPVLWSLGNLSGGDDACFAADDALLFAPAGYVQSGLFDLAAPKSHVPIWKSKPGFAATTISGDGKVVAFGHVQYGRAGEIQLVHTAGRSVDEAGTLQISGLTSFLRLNRAGNRLAAFRGGIVFDPVTGAEVCRLFKNAPAEAHDAAWIGTTAHVVTLITLHKARGLPGSEEQIVLSDAATGKQLQMMTHPTAMDCLAVSPDGKTIAEAGADKLVRLRDPETLAVKKEFRAHDDGITALAFHPTQPILATGSEDLTVKLWNLETGKQIEELRGAAASVRRLNFSPSGKRLAAKAYDSSVIVWEPESLNEKSVAK
jgi:serine/threonine protein kinase/WD40 repeat protein